jgi:hypothetical protein
LRESLGNESENGYPGFRMERAEQQTEHCDEDAPAEAL